ncbi:MAG: single-stranded DNA-binding protein [Abditibacteriaceae bacterium]
MASMNKVILIGRLTADPEMRYTAGEVAVASFSVAVDRFSKNAQGEKTTDFFRCKAWRQTGEFVNNYLKKGALVALEGRIELNSFTGQDGVKKFVTDIVCNQVESLSSPRDRAPEGDTDGYAAAPPASAPAPTRSNPSAARPPAGGAEFDDFDDSDPFADE